MIPHKLIDSSEERKKRDEGRSKMIEKMKKNLREPDIFKNKDIVYIQDKNGKWTVRAMVLNRHKHQGVESSSYMLKKSKTGRITCRNKRVIRRFAGDSLDNQTGSKADNQMSGEESVMNAVTTSCSYTGISSIC